MYSVQLTALPYSPDSLSWFALLRNCRQPVWLDSGRPLSQYGRFDIMAAEPDITITTRGEETSIVDIAGELIESSLENPLQLLQNYQPAAVASRGEVPFVGGFIGYFSYDLGRRFEQLPLQAVDDIAMPEMDVGRYLWAIVQDHEQEKAWLIEHPQAQLSPLLRQSIMFHDLKQNIRTEDLFFKISKFCDDINADYYFEGIRKIKEYIFAGDCYQVNFAQRFSARFEGDPFAAYALLRTVTPSPFSAFYRTANATILSLSPERFIDITHGVAETRPIKGTIARGTTPAMDADNARQLQASTKNRAENLMIVDLLRNDLSKHCDSVKVPALFALQSFANVHHLVSFVEGKLRPGVHPLDVFQACFPGGSITGAPKIRAMEIIEELEPTRRAIYCGSLGYFSADGAMDTSIAIRTLVCADGKVHCWGGGGIVADSDWEEEYQESLTKVGLLMKTLEENFFSESL